MNIQSSQNPKIESAKQMRKGTWWGLVIGLLSGIIHYGIFITYYSRLSVSQGDLTQILYFPFIIGSYGIAGGVFGAVIGKKVSKKIFMLTMIIFAFVACIISGLLGWMNYSQEKQQEINLDTRDQIFLNKTLHDLNVNAQ